MILIDVKKYSRGKGTGVKRVFGIRWELSGGKWTYGRMWGHMVDPLSHINHRCEDSNIYRHTVSYKFSSKVQEALCTYILFANSNGT